MPGSLETALVFILFIVPGFIASRLIRTLVPGSLRADPQTILLALVLSLIIHVMALGWTVQVIDDPLLKFFRSLVDGNSDSIAVSIAAVSWLVFVVLLLPLALAVVISLAWRGALLQKPLDVLGLSMIQMTPQAWDWFFLSQTRGCWVVAELSDGTLIGGGPYGEKSFASVSPHKPDLFLERRVDVNERHELGQDIPTTAGVWIRGENVRSHHSYRAETEES